LFYKSWNLPNLDHSTKSHYYLQEKGKGKQGRKEMKRNDDSVNEKIKELVDRNFTGLFLITGAAVLLLWVLREDDRMLFIVALLLLFCRKNRG
jgi:hypothetical protein